MATLRGFLDEAMKRAGEGANATYDWMKSKAAGLRGAGPAGQMSPADELRARSAVNPGGVSDITPEVEARAAGAERAYNSKVDAFNQRAGMRGAQVRPTPDMTNQVFDDVRLQKEYGPRPAGAAARGPGILARAGSLLRASAPSLAAYGGVSAAVDAAREGNTDADYQAADTPIGKALTGGPAALLSDDFAHATSPIRAAMVGAGRRFANAFNPFGSTEAAAPAPAQSQVAGPITIPEVGTPAKRNPDLVDTVRGGQVTPDELIGGSEVPVSGQGAFQVTKNGVKQPARKVGYESAAPNVPGAPGLRSQAINPARPALPGVFGEIAHMSGLRSADAAARREQGQMNANADRLVRMRGQDLTAGTAMARLQYDAGKSARDNFEKLIGEHANAQVPTADSGLFGSEEGSQKKRDAQVKQYASDLRTRIEYSLGDRKDGKSMEQLSPTEQNQLFLADAFRRKVVDKRGEVFQSFRDLFGNKRFDSRNLYSYMPTKAEPARDGGYLVHFANGNTAKADLVGGEFRLFGPNGPVDADLQQFIAPLIKEAQRRR